MTVIDDILKAEEAAETSVADAKVTATSLVAQARSAQADAIQSEKQRLQELEKSELTSYKTKVAEQTKKIADTSRTQVAAIETAFAAKSADISKKIKQAFQ